MASEDPYDLTVVLDYPFSSARHPIMFPSPSDARRGQGAVVKRMRTGRLTGEELRGREDAFHSLLARELPRGVTGLESDMYAPGYHDINLRSIETVFAGEQRLPLLL